MRRRAALIARKGFFRSLLVLAAWSSACGGPDPQPARLSLLIEARSSALSREPVPDVRVWADGRALGVTDGQGRMRAQLVGHAQQSVLLSFACPPAYRTPAPERNLVLGRFDARAGRGAAELELTVACEPLERTLVLVARAEGPGVAGLPLLAGSAPVGQIELDGTAHVLLKLPPRTSLRVQIDTRARPELVPRNPVQTFQLEDDDSLVLVDQRFSRAAPAQSRQRRVDKSFAGPHLPYRIGRR